MALMTARTTMVLTAAVVVLCVAVGEACSFPWRTAAPSAMMKAPGGAGLLISRAAFEANPQRYFELLHTGGPQAAAAAFHGVGLTGCGGPQQLLRWLPGFRLLFA